MESTSCEKNSVLDALTAVEMRAALEQYRAELSEKDRVIADLKSRLELQEGVNRELELQLGRFHDVLKPLTVQLTHNLQLSAGRHEQYALPPGGARLKASRYLGRTRGRAPAALAGQEGAEERRVSMRHIVPS
ncbi:hypothetical protein MTO96_017434 [Rhipicephalus appendiculatus]